MQKGTRPLHLRWKVVYKLVNTIDSSFKKQIVDAEKYEQAGGPKRKTGPVRVNPNEIVIEKIWEELFMNPAIKNKSCKLLIDESGVLHQGVTLKPKLQRSLSVRSQSLSRQNSSIMKMKIPVNEEEDEDELLSLITKLNKKYEAKKALKQPAQQSIDMGSSSQ